MVEKIVYHDLYRTLLLQAVVMESLVHLGLLVVGHNQTGSVEQRRHLGPVAQLHARCFGIQTKKKEEIYIAYTFWCPTGPERRKRIFEWEDCNAPN